MKTAQEFLQDYKNNTDHYADQEYSEDSMINALVAFAQQHVLLALQAASEQAKIHWEQAGLAQAYEEFLWVDKKSILESYPLNKIKAYEI